MSSLKALFEEQGQAVWLDFIQRSLLVGGELERLVQEVGVRGVTSNPTIFCNAIAGSEEYDEALSALQTELPGATTTELYEALAIEDIRLASGILRSVYDASGGDDGYVSLEVSPLLASDTSATVAEARRLWKAVDRPNLMIKVPATREGIPAIETLIGDGINVNATLIFALSYYEEVAGAYLRGVERCPDPARVASVASFFVSRVDTAVDAQLEEMGTPEALKLRGRAAIANGQLAYRRFKEIFHGPAFAPHRGRGAKVQRPLWASTSAKNPAYSDVVYVDGLIGRETVNTLPLATIKAFIDHGTASASLEAGLAGSADAACRALKSVGVDLDAVTDRLLADGVRSFAESFDQLMAALDRRRAEAEGES